MPSNGSTSLLDFLRGCVLDDLPYVIFIEIQRQCIVDQSQLIVSVFVRVIKEINIVILKNAFFLLIGNKNPFAAYELAVSKPMIHRRMFIQSRPNIHQWNRVGVPDQFRLWFDDIEYFFDLVEFEMFH